MATAQFTSLFSNSVLSRLERMRIVSKRKLTSRHRGEHLSGKGGASTEFVDYRDYVAGDDIRSVDWNIFARLQRPYVKLYRMEEEMHVVVLIDASRSMQFQGKFLRAQQLAAAFAVSGLMNLEPVSIFACQHQESAPQQLLRSSGRVSLKRVCHFLEEIPVGGEYPIEAAVESVLKIHRGRGVAILLSDFLTFGELQKPLNQLFSAGLETFAIQILSPEEQSPDLKGDLRLIDSESQHTLDISGIGALLNVYRDHLQQLQDGLGRLCRQRSGRFLVTDASSPIETLLFDTLRRQGWLQ